MGKQRKNSSSSNEPSSLKGKKKAPIEKIKKSIEKASKVREKAGAILKIDAKSVKNKERRKELVRKQKLESRKLRKLQKLKEKRVRTEHGEAVLFSILDHNSKK